MKNNRRSIGTKIGALLLAFSLTAGVVPRVNLLDVVAAYAAEEETPTSGTCGDNLTWKLDENGTLTISGTGKMEDFNKKVAPWRYRDVYSIVIEDGVTSIGDDAFSYCDMTEMTIPNSVTSIGFRAFDSCLSLTSINIPGSVAWIDSAAFENCQALTEINVIGNNSIFSSENGVLFENGKTVLVKCPEGNKRTTYSIPNTVTSIDKHAFEHCTSLTSVNIPDSVTSIGNGAFAGCTSLTLVNIPDSVILINARVFDGCSSLTSIKIPDSVTSIGKGAFRYCTSLTSVNIPNRVTSIRNDTFTKCTSLTSINIPDNVTSIGNEAFAYCTSLSFIKIPNSVTSIGKYAFEETALVNNQNTKIKYADKWIVECEQSIVTEDIKHDTIGIADEAFRDCTSLISIDIPNKVTSIGNSAFEGCSSLTSINIPDKVTSIKSGTFRDCTKLLSVSIPENVTEIGGLAFENTALVNNQNTKIKYVGKWIVECDKSIVTEDIRSDTIGIAYGTFENCSTLNSINIPESVTSIGMWAFYRCPLLTTINIPKGVTSIGDGVFAGCSSLVSIKIPDSVTLIGEMAFIDCTALTSITIPSSVVSIDSFAFAGCPALTDVYYGGTREEWDAIAIKDGNDELLNATIHYTNTPKTPVLSGKIESSESIISDTMIKLTDSKGTTFTAEITDGTYSFKENIPDGEYTLNVTKSKHCPRQSSVTISRSKPVELDVELHLYGDANFDGAIDAKDATQILRYCSGLSSAFGDGDEYRLQVANVRGNGTLAPQDATQILKNASLQSSVFDTIE